MIRRTEHPAPPRLSEPDLPDILSGGGRIRARTEHFQRRFDALESETDADHAVITECRIAGAATDAWSLTGATLIDVDIEHLRATTITARESRWRRVRITGGRIGTLDLSAAELDEVELRGIRIDYLALGRSRVEDLLITDCTFTTLDVPGATLRRAAFSDSRADELDTRGLSAENVDLRGLEVLSITDPTAVRGVTMSERQVDFHARAFATSLGVHVAGER
ncbi:pentapeptide repeat-containing protein [Microbacterium koreense]|uniref:Pentapeptide repeat-containing protein n=1 Tax=Microbacterium koreense TaxID=323761 RepID=A0ABW2ZS03_9MICO